MLQEFLSLLQGLCVFDGVEVGQDTHDFRHPMNLANIEELENFHFKTETGVTQQEDQVGTFGNVDHTIDVVVALNQRDPALLRHNNRDWSIDIRHICLGKVLD